MKKLLLICSVFCFISASSIAQSSKTKTRTGKVSKHKQKGSVASRVRTREKNLRHQLASKRRSTAANRKRNAKTSVVKRSTAAKSTARFASFSATDMREKKNSYLQMTDEEQLLGAGFAKSRGKLPWPVEGTISIPFGDYTIEETTIKGRNPGITISTPNKDVPVKAVFDGVVSDIDGNDEVATVYIRHGNYYTVYSNLSAIHVKKGALVKMGEAIGSVGEAYSTTGGELMFVVMAETDNVNPASWLRK